MGRERQWRREYSDAEIEAMVRLDDRPRRDYDGEDRRIARGYQARRTRFDEEVEDE